MVSRTLFTASELESIGVFLEEKDAIRPFLLPLSSLPAVVHGEEETPGAATIILPDMELFWRLHARPEGVEDVAVLDADEVLESEDSVDEDDEPAPESVIETGNGVKKPPKLPPVLPEEAGSPPPLPQGSPEESAVKAPPLPPRVSSEANWSDNFFDDDYVSTLDHPNVKKTKLEVEFIYSQLNLSPEKNFLDIGCADGRHAVMMALKGCRSMGIDTSVPFLLIANETTQDLSAQATFIKKDMREFTPAEPVHAMSCFGGTFGYFTDPENIDLVRRFFSWLVPGGRMLLDVMNRDYVVSQLPSRLWWEGNGCMVMDECTFNYPENRLMVKRNIAFVSGKQRNYLLSVRTYTLREITDIVQQAGFRILETSGCVYSPGAFTGMLSPSILLTLEK